jgi:hypothetical protein
MFEDNKPWQRFRDKLTARGVIMRCMWKAHAGVWHGISPDGRRVADKRRNDVALYAFIGKDFSPAEATAIMVDYGPRDGFGLWFEARTNSIDEDVARIVGSAAEAETPIERSEDIDTNEPGDLSPEDEWLAEGLRNSQE